MDNSEENFFKRRFCLNCTCKISLKSSPTKMPRRWFLMTLALKLPHGDRYGSNITINYFWHSNLIPFYSQERERSKFNMVLLGTPLVSIVKTCIPSSFSTRRLSRTLSSDPIAYGACGSELKPRFHSNKRFHTNTFTLDPVKIWLISPGSWTN